MPRVQNVRRVLWLVLALNLGVTLIKLMVGFASGALAVVADGFHSIVDSSSNVIGLLGVWVASRPADRNHPYGHQKYESVATLGIGGLLLVAAFEIGQSVAARLLGAEAAPQISPLTIGLMALTFVVNLGITVYETRMGRHLKSDLLLADAAHTRADLWVTLSVIASLVGARFGLAWLDPLVAGLVVILLTRAAFGILRSSSEVLTDVAVADPDAVRRAALSVPGVNWVANVRSRGRSDAVYVDLHVRVNPAMDTAQAHALASEVERRISADVPGVVDTVVHIEPSASAASMWEEISLKLRALADGLGLGMHDLHAHAEREGGFSLEMHVEVEAALTLGQAHALVDEFEHRAHAALPGLRSLVTHIEPLPAPAALPDEEGALARAAALRQRIALIADNLAGRGACHNIELHNVGGHLTATLHITQPANQPLLKSHALAEAIEGQLHAHEESLDRVVVHVEPPE
jgi:cation diffusion facilitator family transporter